jgi:hypothetical protein|tara:strand:+ start:58 stop:291 length:234 start_codon:yes stop_codon:yes gene_type:complete
MNYRCLINRRIISNFFIYVVFAIIPACGLEDQTNSQSLQYVDFSLADVNPNSPTYGSLIGPSYYNGNVSSYYFGDQG